MTGRGNELGGGELTMEVIEVITSLKKLVREAQSVPGLSDTWRARAAATLKKCPWPEYGP